MNKTFEMWTTDLTKKLIENNDHGSFIGKRSVAYKNKVTITFHEERKVMITGSRLVEILKDYTCITRNEIIDAVFNQKEGE